MILNFQQKSKGFTLLELMLVVSVIGIIAAIALPAYQDYTVRSKVSELMLSATAAKMVISEYAISNSTIAGIKSDSVNIIDINQGMVSSVIWDGTYIRVNGNKTSLGEEVILLMRPSGNPLSGINWICSAEVGTNFLPKSCN